MMWKHIKFLSDLSRQWRMKMFSRRRNLSDTGHFSRIYGWFLCSLCHSFWQGCWRKDKNIDTREACWVSAIVSGHGGIGEEDRALSCLPVHVLCFQNCSHFVVVIRTLSCCLSYGLWMHNITWLVLLSAWMSMFLSFVLSRFGCDIELYLWPHFGIGTRSVWSPSRFGFNIGLCLWLHFSIGIRSAWLHSNFSSTVVSASSHVSLLIRCKRKHMICFFHLSPGTLTSFDDVVASFSYRRADSNATAII